MSSCFLASFCLVVGVLGRRSSAAARLGSARVPFPNRGSLFFPFWLARADENSLVHSWSGFFTCCFSCCFLYMCVSGGFGGCGMHARGEETASFLALARGKGVVVLGVEVGGVVMSCLANERRSAGCAVVFDLPGVRNQGHVHGWAPLPAQKPPGAAVDTTKHLRSFCSDFGRVVSRV